MTWKPVVANTWKLKVFPAVPMPVVQVWRVGVRVFNKFVPVEVRMGKRGFNLSFFMSVDMVTVIVAVSVLVL